MAATAPTTPTGLRRSLALFAGLLLAGLAGACSAPAPQAGAGPATAGRSTSDARVKPFLGTVPPDVFTDGTWVTPVGPTSLAAQKGRVVLVLFAFPT